MHVIGLIVNNFIHADLTRIPYNYYCS